MNGIPLEIQLKSMTKNAKSLILFVLNPWVILSSVALSITLTGTDSLAQAVVCKRIYSEPKIAPSLPKFIEEVPLDLSAAQQKDASKFSKGELKKINKKKLQQLEEYIPEQGTERAGAVALSEIQPLLEVVEKHSVVSPENKGKYQQEDVDIGYCFGRAAYLHLLMLKMGLAKQSIVKLWAVGPQANPSGDKNWGFHVATATYVRGYGWMTIDTNSFKIQPIRHWIQGNLDRSVDGKMQIYVTSAERFGLNVPKYDRLQMGLDITREQDWYRGYFKDMLQSVREDSLESLGLKKFDVVPVAPKKPKPSTWESITNFFVN